MGEVCTLVVFIGVATYAVLVPCKDGEWSSPPQSNSVSFLPPGEAEEGDRAVGRGKYDTLMLTSSTALGAETTACTSLGYPAVFPLLYRRGGENVWAMALLRVVHSGILYLLQTPTRSTIMRLHT